MGYFWALMSVLLVSGAQLSMKWAMIQLPPVSWETDFFYSVLLSGHIFLVLMGGLAAYAFSMCCWYLALQSVPLSTAYPLLSLSYVLVWCGAVCLPLLNEQFSPGKMSGLIMIFIGLLLIFIQRRR